MTYGFVCSRFRTPRAQATVLTVLGVLYSLVLFQLTQVGHPGYGPKPNSTRFGLADAAGAFTHWWLIGSTVAFVVAVPIRILTRIAIAVDRRLRNPAPAPKAPEGFFGDRPRVLERRHFLEHCATGVVTLPFAATGYALLRGRVDLEVVRTGAPIARLPKQFAGFRIAQLSDIHIGPFMEAWRIREYAAVANSLKPHMIVLTGDFVCWDPTVAGEVVGALSGLRAPCGVFACLGNHEAWSGAKDSIASLFEKAGIRVLRDARTRIALGGATINVIGIEPDHGWSSRQVPEGLAVRDCPNILLSHYPDVFDHAASIGIDLTLAGHTHGGQVKLNYVSPYLMPSKAVLPYLAGWFERPGGRLYVNRGIGTIFVPMRFGRNPEITLFELSREG